MFNKNIDNQRKITKIPTKSNDFFNGSASTALITDVSKIVIFLLSKYFIMNGIELN